MTSNNACKYNSFVSYFIVNTTMAKKKKMRFCIVFDGKNVRKHNNLLQVVSNDLQNIAAELN
jgi:hypothetical protein